MDPSRGMWGPKSIKNKRILKMKKPANAHTDRLTKGDFYGLVELGSNWGLQLKVDRQIDKGNYDNANYISTEQKL